MSNDRTYNIGMFRKKGEKLSPEKEEELSHKLSPILVKFSNKFDILIHKFEDGLNAEERIYFRRNVIYSLIQDLNKWKTYGDCIPDYVKIGWNFETKRHNKVILFTLKDFEDWLNEDK